MSKERLIKISDNRVFIAPDVSLCLAQTNIPPESRFRSSEGAYWKVKVTKVDRSCHSVTLRVVDYHPTEVEPFEEQGPKHEVARIEFEPFDWDELEGFLISYRKSDFQGLMIKKEEAPSNEDLDDPWEQLSMPAARPVHREPEIEEVEVPSNEDLDDPREQPSVPAARPVHREPKIEEIEAECRIDFKEVRFGDGYVEFSYRPNRLRNALDFKVHNPHILSEFQYVKQYFRKVFDSRVFTAYITVRLQDGCVLDKVAKAPLLESIDQNTIQSIRDCRSLSLLKHATTPKAKKRTFTAIDVFDNFEPAESTSQLSIFKQSEQDILSLLARQGGIRNKQQLEYLAGDIQSPDQVIRFTLKPLFGFIFFRIGVKQHHFCWELLNSNATYVWSLGKNRNVEHQFARIDQIIARIHDIGRQEYRRGYERGELDSDIEFTPIIHRGINSAPEVALNHWKDNLKRLLV